MQTGDELARFPAPGELTCVAADPRAREICCGGEGGFLFRLAFRGRLAHGARPPSADQNTAPSPASTPPRPAATAEDATTPELDDLFREAEAGSAVAQSKLGDRYLQGLGVPQDYERAVNWYRRAAEDGCVVAQVALGDCYARGEGVLQDRVRAAEWYVKAAEKRYTPAIHRLDKLRRGGFA